MTLKNKLGIHNAVELSRQEERLSKQRALELFDEGLLDTFEIGTFAGLQAIHAHLFCDVFSADDPLTSGIHGVNRQYRQGELSVRSFSLFGCCA